MRVQGLISVLFAVVGCETGPQVTEMPGNAELGVAKFVVKETDEQVSIVGVDDRGTTVATVRLRVGRVAIPDEALVGYGRELELVIGDERASHASVGMLPLALPHPENRQLDQLAIDPTVAGVLGTWGITVVEPLQVEAPYAANNAHNGACSYWATTLGISNLFVPPCGGAGATSCCMEMPHGPSKVGATDLQWDARQLVVCGNSNPTTRAIRTCPGPGRPGFTSRDGLACGASGGGGCAVCWTETYSGGTWAATYTATTDSCDWQWTPTPQTLTVSTSGNGVVSSSPAGIDCGADCSEAYSPSTMVTLYASPGASTLFTGWTGDCTGTADCIVTMSQARNVTATFLACTDDAQPCGYGQADCCSGFCSDTTWTCSGVCMENNATTCDWNYQCCSNYCNAGTCEPDPSCVAGGDYCSVGAECCSLGCMQNNTCCDVSVRDLVIADCPYYLGVCSVMPEYPECGCVWNWCGFP